MITISLAVVVIGLAGVAVASTLTTGEVGPSLRLTANGRLLHPVGRLTTVGNFPTGSALAAGGRALWVTDCGHGKDDIKVVNVEQRQGDPDASAARLLRRGHVRAERRCRVCRRHTEGRLPDRGPDEGRSGRRRAYVHGQPEDGRGTELGPIQLPATTGGSGRINSLPPVSGVGTAQPVGIAASPSGRYLVVALNAADEAVVIDLRTETQRLVHVGSYPNSVAFDARAAPTSRTSTAATCR